MKIGIFHPGLNTCGGGEWVALNIVNSLRKKGHKIIILTDETIDQKKFLETFGQKIEMDEEFVFPLHLFSRGDPHNVYTDIISCFIFKQKCDKIIDTYTCLILPWTDAVYVHYPLLSQSSLQKSTIFNNKVSKLKNRIYYYPYAIYERMLKKKMKQIIFVNSQFTSRAVTKILGLNSNLLYPPLSPFFNQKENILKSSNRINQVVTVSRFAPEKNLEIIPIIAKKCEKVNFKIIGTLHYKKIYKDLSKLIKEYDLEDRVKLITNANRNKLRNILLESKIYLHSALNEHFGVSIIDAMASGCIPLVHNSGGPKEFVPENYRYNTIDEASIKIKRIIREWSSYLSVSLSAIAKKFNQEDFSNNFIKILSQKNFFNDR